METITHSPASLALLFLISAFAIFIVHAVFRRLQNATPALRGLEAPVEALGGFSYRQLVLVSFLTLFVEMLMIRWVSSEVRIFAYFKNFVLVACFLGFGLGCYLCRRRLQLSAMIAPLLLLTVMLKSPLSPLRRTMSALPQLLGGGVEVHVWGVPAAPTSWLGMFLALAVVVPLFAVIATTFIPFGQLVGWYLEKAPNGVAAYSVNVLASLAGIAAFTMLCFLYQPPWVWFLVAGIFSLLVFWRPGRRIETIRHVVRIPNDGMDAKFLGVRLDELRREVHDLLMPGVIRRQRVSVDLAVVVKRLQDQLLIRRPIGRRIPVIGDCQQDDTCKEGCAQSFAACGITMLPADSSSPAHASDWRRRPPIRHSLPISQGTPRCRCRRPG